MPARIVLALTVLYLLAVVADPAQYAGFGFTGGIFFCVIAFILGVSAKDSRLPGTLVGIGVLLFGIAAIGINYRSQIQLIAGIAVIILLIWGLFRFRRRQDRRHRHHQHRHA